MAAIAIDGTPGAAPASAARPAAWRDRLRRVGDPTPGLPVLLPLLLQPTVAAILPSLGAAVLFLLLDRLAEAVAPASSGPSPGARPWPRTLGGAVLIAATTVLAVLLGPGVPVLALLGLLLLACGRFWRWRRPASAAAVALAAAVAACKVDAGALAAGLAVDRWALLAAAATAALLAAVRAKIADAAGRAGPGGLAAPARPGRARDVFLVVLLAACVAANLAWLSAAARLQAYGAPLALLPAGFLVLGLLRCFRSSGRPAESGARAATLADPLLAAALVGWCAAVLAGPLLRGGA